MLDWAWKEVLMCEKQQLLETIIKFVVLKKREMVFDRGEKCQSWLKTPPSPEDLTSNLFNKIKAEGTRLNLCAADLISSLKLQISGNFTAGRRWRSCGIKIVTCTQKEQEDDLYAGDVVLLP